MITRICRAIAILGLLMSALIPGGCGSNTPSSSTPSSSAPAGATIITIPSGATGKGSAAFGTNPLHVAAGTKISWLNSDSMTHTATSTGNWDTGNISAGAYSSVVTISAAGTYNYFCTIHGVGSMSGQIISP